MRWDNNARLGLAAAVGLLAATLPAAGAAAQFFPGGPTFTHPLAHPRPTALYGRVLSVSRGESAFGAEREAEAGAGATIAVMRLGGGARPMSLGLGLGVVARFSLDDPRSALISTDWTVGLHAAAHLARWRLDLNVYHESSHLGDEYLDRFDAARVDWTREVGSVWASRSLGEAFTLHAQVSYALLDELDLARGAGGLGVDYRGRLGSALGATVRPIAGVYFESQAFARWRVTSTGRVGVALDSGGRSVSISLVALDGLSSQRQFFGNRSRYVGLELRFD